jgi:hypothetical protein
VTNQKSPDMHIPAPKAEWNINTIISVAGFALTLAGGVYAYGQLTSQVGYTANELTSYKAATDIRLTGVETAVRQIDNLAFRMSAAETSNAAVTRALGDLQSAVSNQSGDIKVIREILVRIEQQSTPASFTPLALAVP